MGAAAAGATAAPTGDIGTASPLSRYVQARLAASSGADDRASADFAAVLDAAPDNQIVAAQAMSHGISAGDWPLALRGARALEQAGALRPDARLLIVADAFRRRDWATARREVAAAERERIFAFMAPILRAWIAYGSGAGDPLAQLGQGDGAGGYVEEHHALLLVAMNRPEGRAALDAATGAQSVRSMRLRIAGAGLIASRGDRAGALALLAGDDGPIVAARSLVQAGRPVSGAFDGANSGMAELLLRFALDLDSRDLTAPAIGFARIATYLDPASSEGWLIAAELTAKEDRPAEAVPLLAHVDAADPFADVVRDTRARLLVAAGNAAEALADAEAAAGAPGAGASDQIRLGQVLMAMGRSADAAAAFGRAVELRGPNDMPEAAILLAQAGALDQAGNWPAARALLERANRIQPNNALILNYLGYGQLSHREDMAAAEQMVREAHRLAPDNAAITDSLGWALFLKGDKAGAITLLESAAQAAPADVEINEHLGDAYYAMGRRLDARFAWRAARVYADGEDAARLDSKIAGGPDAQAAAR
ncbi:tetratricopeptide repeat protein [Sphingosinicella ginsenosidimutans]|uniref:Tetratricopeptide repeat protein n=1 Tax=Allosphingosinicella ginsenosidimutans TaxID=1176539 RepID=A0A5C6TUU2_9SPHN|nr:tetratricopeptide repeat protein [Sphingosinicella ginsenosidimutans]TXC64234.1 tetratricopeptide repeat protein [Sphingosinicella ginsenosidimutans]